MAVRFAPAWRGVWISLVLLAPVLPAATACAEEPAARLEPVSASPSTIPLSLPRVGGGRTSLNDGRGRVRLVHFFATWCGPCRPELASLDRLQGDLAPGLNVLAVSVAEPEQRLQRFFAERPVGFPVLLDQDRSASRAWGVEILPSTVVVDPDGYPRLVVRGALDWQAGEVRAALSELRPATARSHQSDQTQGEEK